jgi:Cof subfamily protein (haloacid dehalogenase superfamily)
MKNIKIISMDFDGTLLTKDKKISNRTLKCLINLKNKSYKIIGVTARNLLSVKNIIDVKLFDYILLNNGADIYYVNDDKLENIGSIDNKTALNIFNLYDKKSNQIDFCTSYEYLIKSNNKYDNRPFIKYINGFDDVKDSISRMNIFFENSKELEENRSFIEKTFDNINVVKMIDTDKDDSRIWLAINPKEVSKLNTLKKICNDLKCSISEVIFFGDGENDLVLIENAGVGIAMGNAIDIVKEKASFITLSNDQDGIAVYLENNIE